MSFQRNHYYGGGWPKGRHRHPGGTNAKCLVKAAIRDGLSWRELGRIVGIDPRQLKKYLTGKHYPSPVRLRRLERKLWCYLS